jgi:hypothetical protein
LSNCITVSIDREKHNKERGWNGGLSQTDERWESNLTAVDPLSGEIKKNSICATRTAPARSRPVATSRSWPSWMAPSHLTTTPRSTSYRRSTWVRAFRHRQ